MTQQQRMMYIVVGFGVLLAALLFSPQSKPKTVQQKAVAGDSVRDIEAVLEKYRGLASKNIDLRVIEETAEKYQSEAFSRDPFAFLREVQEVVVMTGEDEAAFLEPPPEFEIQGVLYNANFPTESVAIIFGEEKKIGDTVMKWEIISIGDNQVTFQRGDRQHNVRLYG